MRDKNDISRLSDGWFLKKQLEEAQAYAMKQFKDTYARLIMQQGAIDGECYEITDPKRLEKQ